MTICSRLSRLKRDQTSHGRYNDVKLAKNCCRAYAANDIQEQDDPKDDERHCITMNEFLTLLRRTFPGNKLTFARS